MSDAGTTHWDTCWQEHPACAARREATMTTKTLDRPCLCGHVKKVHGFREGGYTGCYGSHRCLCREYVPKED